MVVADQESIVMLSVAELYGMLVLALINAEKWDDMVCLKIPVHLMLVNKKNSLWKILVRRRGYVTVTWLCSKIFSAPKYLSRRTLFSFHLSSEEAFISD